MDKCDYGCGQRAKHVFKNGKRCCSAWYRSCPFQAKKIGLTRLGKRHSKETKRKIGEASRVRMQQHNPFKGKPLSEEHKKKISERNRGRIKPPNYVPWNKGLTKDSDPRIACGDQVRHSGSDNGMFGKTHTDNVKEKQRQRNLKEGKWKGENNPWYGKDRSGENSPRFMSEKERTEWELFRNVVRSKTETTYKQHKQMINPNNLKRSTRGYHLDHIIPIWYGFQNKIPINTLTNPKNLRIIHCEENYKRYKTKLTHEEKTLLEELTQL